MADASADGELPIPIVSAAAVAQPAQVAAAPGGGLFVLLGGLYSAPTAMGTIFTTSEVV